MRRIRREQLFYGAFWGLSAFVVGWILTWMVLPKGLLSVPRWKMVSWFYLNANWVPIGVENFPGVIQRADFLIKFSEYQYLRAVPVATCVPAALLVNSSLGYTERGRYLLENSLSIILGYGAAGIIVMVVSDARPAFNTVLILVIVFGGALVIGSRLLNIATGGLPIIGIASVGTIILIGLLAILGGIILVRAIVPLVAVPAISGIGGAVLLWSSRNAPV